MAIPDPSKAGSPFSPLQTDGWNPKTPEINNFFIPLFSFRRGYPPFLWPVVFVVSSVVRARRALRVGYGS